MVNEAAKSLADALRTSEEYTQYVVAREAAFLKDSTVRCTMSIDGCKYAHRRTPPPGGRMPVDSNSFAGLASCCNLIKRLQIF